MIRVVMAALMALIGSDVLAHGEQALLDRAVIRPQVHHACGVIDFVRVDPRSISNANNCATVQLFYERVVGRQSGGLIRKNSGIPPFGVRPFDASFGKLYDGALRGDEGRLEHFSVDLDVKRRGDASVLDLDFKHSAVSSVVFFEGEEASTNDLNPRPVFCCEKIASLLVGGDGGVCRISIERETVPNKKHGPSANPGRSDGKGRHDPLRIGIIPRVEILNGGYDARDIFVLIILCLCGGVGSFHVVGWLTEPRRKNDSE